jgi:DNA-binding NarL/FixJ family response regulator
MLVDDQSLLRAGFRLVLEQDTDLEVVAEAADGSQAVSTARRYRPDVILMDIRIVVLTTFEIDDYITDALQAGASGFLLKQIEPEELRRAVHTVADGDALLSPSVTRPVLADLRSRGDRRPKDPERLGVLTAREREVLALSAEATTRPRSATSCS